MGNMALVCLQYLSQMLEVLQVFAPSTQISPQRTTHVVLNIVESIINIKNEMKIGTSSSIDLEWSLYDQQIQK
jgi:hypothetical protein